MGNPVLKNKVALVAGGTRGAGRGIAAELGASGAIVTLQDAAPALNALSITVLKLLKRQSVNEAGGYGIPVQVNHLDPVQVQALIARIEGEQGRLDVLVNDIWGGESLTEWNVPVWQHSLEKGLRMLRLAIDTHIIITSHFALPLLIKNPGGLVVEITDGTAEYNSTNYRLSLFTIWQRHRSSVWLGRWHKSFNPINALYLSSLDKNAQRRFEKFLRHYPRPPSTPILATVYT